jgi:predicted Ser/Thr protein kinase
LSVRSVGDLEKMLKAKGYSEKAVREILKWYK